MRGGLGRGGKRTVYIRGRHELGASFELTAEDAAAALAFACTADDFDASVGVYYLSAEGDNVVVSPAAKRYKCGPVGDNGIQNAFS